MKGHFKKIIIFVSAVLATLCLSAYSVNKQARFEAEFLTLFDTVTRIIGYSSGREEFSHHSKLIYDKLFEYHKLYDIYNSYDGVNNIKTINDNAGRTPVKVDERIIDLLLFAKDMNAATSGKMNVALGSVLEIWHDCRTKGIDDPENAALPSLETLKSAAEHTDINDIIIDTKAQTVYLADPEMSIDVGAVGKGYAAERVSEYARENGFNSGIISVGGNVRTIGSRNGKGWSIGVENPEKDSKEKTLSVVSLSDYSLVTSGAYQRYYTVNGREYHHIINPDTLFPSECFTAVTIAVGNSGVADALSTAVFNMPFEEGKRLIESMPETYALWVMKNGEVRYSSGFELLLKKR